MPRKTRRAGVNDFSYDAVGLFKGNRGVVRQIRCRAHSPRTLPSVSLRTPDANGMGKVDVMFVVEIYPPNNVMQTSLLNRT